MVKKKIDGLRYPSIDTLLNKVESKYMLCILASRRARTLVDDNLQSPVVENKKCQKAIGMALEEILNGETTLLSEEEASKLENE